MEYTAGRTCLKWDKKLIYSDVLPAYLITAYLVTRISRHFFFESPLAFTFVILKSDISSPGYLVILTSVRALTIRAGKTV